MSANLDNGVMLGALGSAYVNTDGEVSPPTGMIIAAIQFISGSASTGGTGITALKAAEPTRFFNTVEAANSHTLDGAAAQTVDEGSGGDTLPNNVKYPAGITIYGRWSAVTFSGDTTGGAICYFGY